MTVRAAPGDRFGKLVIERLQGSTGNGHRLAVCRCDCGSEIEARVGELKRGARSSCGCARHAKLIARNTKHGGFHTRLYSIWSKMLARCGNPRHVNFHNYGGRGITVCDRWKSFEFFREDMGEPPPGKTLDRVDNDGGYCPANCRWATLAEQGKNRRKSRVVVVDGKKLSVVEWAALTGVSRATAYRRRKFALEDAIRAVVEKRK